MTPRAETSPRLRRRSSSGRIRFLVSVGVGLVVAVGVGVVAPPRYGALAGLMTMAGTYIAWTFTALRHFNGPETRAHAKPEDTGAALSDLGGAVVISGNVAAVITLLVLDRDNGRHSLDALLTLASVLLSWFLLHTLYVGRYARLYYAGWHRHRAHSGAGAEQPVPPGIDFNADGYLPTYADFTYIAFNLGMTYQVSDTSVSDPDIRRLVLHHCLLSYFFATGITASVINLVVGLVT